MLDLSNLRRWRIITGSLLVSVELGLGVNLLPLGITGEGKDCGVVVVSGAERDWVLSEVTNVQEPNPAKIITIKPITPNTKG